MLGSWPPTDNEPPMTNTSAHAPKRRPRLRLRAGLATVAFVAAGCGLLGADAEETAPPPAQQADAEAGAGAAEDLGSGEITGDDGAGAPAAPTDGLAPACTPTEATTLGTVATPALTETSGLAASARHPGVLWAHNDSGAEPAIHAIGPAGEDLGAVSIPSIPGVDIEDMALAGGFVYLADIGDNNARRDSVALYRFPEPDLPTADGQTVAAETVEVAPLTYPDGATDAEALLVDPVSGQVAIVAKTVVLRINPDAPIGAGAASVYVADPLWDGSASAMTKAGAVALDDLADVAEGEIPAGEIADFGVAGVATAADVRADGAVIALRTYQTVWLFSRAEGQSLADALMTQPCPARTILEPQGEAVAFANDGTGAFFTVSEGAQPALNRTTLS